MGTTWQDKVPGDPDEVGGLAAWNTKDEPDGELAPMPGVRRRRVLRWVRSWR